MLRRKLIAGIIAAFSWAKLLWELPQHHCTVSELPAKFCLPDGNTLEISLLNGGKYLHCRIKDGDSVIKVVQLQLCDNGFCFYGDEDNRYLCEDGTTRVWNKTEVRKVIIGKVSFSPVR